MTAEQFSEAHGAAFVEWLQENTVECACEVKYGCDETKRRGDEEAVNAETGSSRVVGASCPSACTMWIRVRVGPTQGRAKLLQPHSLYPL